MQITRASEYAIRGVLDLCMQPKGAVCLLNEISQRQNVPPSFLSKIFQSLARAGIVSSSRGTGGGFSLMKAPEDITLLDVLEAIEGRIALNVCLSNGEVCENRPVCPVHDVWREAQVQMFALLRKHSFGELAQSSRMRRDEAAREPQPSD
ncbi:MAG: Rrf2 family transcriptional regulator [Candidatus Lindowbacteria bacterium]|nr:Rrf2 family transcriptional regulator [Candidatus Lindowbacteria bacterium]